MSDFEVFPSKCEVLRLDIAQREDVFNQQKRKKLSERRPSFKRFAELSEKRNLRRIILFQKLGECYVSARVQFQKSLSSTT